MIRNYIKVALRHLLRDRFIASINVIGLAIGMSIAVIILIFIELELSYDKFHNNPEQVFRIVQHAETGNGQNLTIPSTLGWVSPELNSIFFPDVAFCRLYNNEMRNRFSFSDIDHVRFFYVDSTFFDIFSFQFLYGDPATALTEPNSVVLTQQMAETYFGSTDALNKPFEIHDKNFNVTGILKELPVYSHLQFDLLLPIGAWPNRKNIHEFAMDFPTYMRFKNTSQIGELRSSVVDSISVIVNHHYGSAGIHVETELQALRDIHLGSKGFDSVIHRAGDRNTVIILSFLALFILLITISNFVNLFTSKSENRLREIGMRMVVGADKMRIWQQLIGESFFTSGVACFFALAFVELFASPFSHIMGINLKITFIELVYLFLLFGLIAFFTSVITGIVHYLYLSRLTPVQVLSVIRIRRGISWLKTVFVIIQFSMMIFLLAVFAILFFQVQFMRSRDPGFNRDGLVVYYEPFKRMVRDFEPVRLNLIQNQNILQAAASEGIPGIPTSVQNIWVEGDTVSNSMIINEHRVKNHYTSTYGIEVKGEAGIDLFKDTVGFLLNERAVELLGLAEPVGSIVNVDVNKYPVLGVVKDFHYKSLHDPIEPLVISNYFRPYRYITLKINIDSLIPVTEYADSILAIHFPEDRFTHFLLSERYETMYEQEQKSMHLVSGGAILAILISMFGLFGLSRETMIKRTKEVGIRKAIGGSRWDIFAMLTLHLLKWVFLAAVISLPVAAYITYNWINEFTYRIGQTWIFLIISGLCALLIAILTISYHTLTIGRMNPVDSLRYE